MGKNLKYLLVAKYMVPKEFVTDYSGTSPPDDHGVAHTEKDDVEHSRCADELDELFDLDQEQGETTKELVIPVEIEEYYPSEEECDEVVQEEKDEDHKPDTVMLHGDCDPPSMTYLTFAVALPNNQAGTVRRALQDILLYLQHHGLPVYRFHADKGEFYNHMLRNWLRDQG
ncbi:ycf43, partial [Symbiodinium microadriaticum]